MGAGRLQRFLRDELAGLKSYLTETNAPDFSSPVARRRGRDRAWRAAARFRRALPHHSHKSLAPEEFTAYGTEWIESTAPDVEDPRTEAHSPAMLRDHLTRNLPLLGGLPGGDRERLPKRMRLDHARHGKEPSY